MQVLVNDQIMKLSEAFPNVTFPKGVADTEFLTQHNAFVVQNWKVYDPKTEKLVACDPYVENNIAYTVSVQSKSEQDIEDERNLISEIVRQERDRKLSATDWTQVADAPVDASAWATYRQALRDVPAQEGFPFDVVWPEKP